MTHAMKKQFNVRVRDLPEHERLILKLIFMVSQRSTARVNTYALIDDATTHADVLLHGAGTSGQGDGAAVRLPVTDSIAGGSDGPAVLRPLIATRVLAMLDSTIATIEEKRVTRAPSLAAEVTRDRGAVAEQTVAGGVDFSISAQEASELAIVEDETLTHPANFDPDADADQPVARPAVRAESVLSREGFSGPTAHVASVDHVRVAEAEAANVSAKRPRAIVVDDSPSVRKQLEIELAHFDVEVDYAASARQAIEMLDTGKYDVAFLDVVLPDWDGFQICKQIKAKTWDTTVIMLTGRATTSDKLKGKLAGCDSYLVKPVGRVTFQTTVKNYLPLMAEATALGI